MEKLHKVCELGMAPEVYYLVNKMRQKLSISTQAAKDGG